MHNLKILVQVKPDKTSQKIAQNSFAQCIKNSLIKIEKPQYFTSYELPENMIFVPGAIRRLHFYNDLASLVNSNSCKIISAYFKNLDQQFGTFSKSYSGVPIGNIDLCGVNRDIRTTYLRCLSGRHFCTDSLSLKFRRSKLKCCPYCKNPSRNLSHYILDCPDFASIRNIFIEKIRNVKSDVSYNLENEDSVTQLFCSHNPTILKQFAFFLHEIKTQFTK